MRLFLGIDLPKEVKDYLFEVQGSLKNSSLARVAWDAKKKFHITLKFLGDVPDEKLEELKSKFGKIKFSKFKIRLDKIGYFPGDSRITVVWVSVTPTDSITELQKIIDYETLSYGEVKLGSPHVTLGRVKFVRHRKGLLEKLNNAKIEKHEFFVESFSLFKSTLSKDGSKYEVIETYKYSK